MERKILLDSDVIRHFIKGADLGVLANIFKGRLVMLDVVRDELCRSKSLVVIITNFISFYKIEEMKFPSHNFDILKAYSELMKDGQGTGESSIMAVARFQKQIIASSNLKDIRFYCLKYNIEYLTTMDILNLALNEKKIDMTFCNEFITKVRNAGSKLPVRSMEEYIKMKSN